HHLISTCILILKVLEPSQTTICLPCQPHHNHSTKHITHIRTKPSTATPTESRAKTLKGNQDQNHQNAHVKNQPHRSQSSRRSISHHNNRQSLLSDATIAQRRNSARTRTKRGRHGRPRRTRSLPLHKQETQDIRNSNSSSQRRRLRSPLLFPGRFHQRHQDHHLHGRG
ncbi:hypothetical protein V8F33_009248, partial [Rhypophila sp. PSN 637]